MCVVASFRQQLHALRIRMRVTAMFRDARSGIRRLGSAAEREIETFGDAVEPPISFGEGDLVDDLALESRNTCSN
jgi:hypothetical protein